MKTRAMRLHRLGVRKENFAPDDTARIFNAVAEPVVTYAMEVATPTRTMERKLGAARAGFLKSALGCSTRTSTSFLHEEFALLTHEELGHLAKLRYWHQLVRLGCSRKDPPPPPASPR